MKALSELLKAVKPLTVEGSCDVEIAGVEIDSRKVKQGDLFVAMKGTQVDGHRFIGKPMGPVYYTHLALPTTREVNSFGGRREIGKTER